MKSNWNEYREAFSDALNNAEQKTDKFIKAQRLKLKISKQNREINSLLLKLGKLTYKCSKENTDLQSEKSNFIHLIDNAVSIKRDLIKEYETLTEYKICPVCNYSNKYDAVYCSQCSNKLD